MKIKGYLGDWFAAFFIVALIYLLVRPQSVAAEAVHQFSEALTVLVRTSTNL